MKIFKRVYIARAPLDVRPYRVMLTEAVDVAGRKRHAIRFDHTVLSRHFTKRGAQRALVKAQKKYGVAN